MLSFNQKSLGQLNRLNNLHRLYSDDNLPQYWPLLPINPSKEQKVYSVFPVVFFIQFWVLHLLEKGFFLYGSFFYRKYRNRSYIPIPILLLICISILILFSYPHSRLPHSHPYAYIISNCVDWKNGRISGVVTAYSKKNYSASRRTRNGIFAAPIFIKREIVEK